MRILVDSTVETGDVSSITGYLLDNIIIFSVIKSINRTSRSANKFLTCSMVTPVDVAITGGVTSDASVSEVDLLNLGDVATSINLDACKRRFQIFFIALLLALLQQLANIFRKMLLSSRDDVLRVDVGS